MLTRDLEIRRGAATAICARLSVRLSVCLLCLSISLSLRQPLSPAAPPPARAAN